MIKSLAVINRCFLTASAGIFILLFTNAVFTSAQQFLNVIYTLEYSPDGQFIAAAGQGFIHVWDADIQIQLLDLEIGDTFVFEVSWSADSTRLVSGSDDQYIRVWNIKGFDFSQGQLITQFIPFPDGIELVTTVAYSSDGSVISVGGIADGYSLKFYDVMSFALTDRYRLGWIEQVMWNPNQHMSAVAVSYQDGPPLIYFLEQGDRQDVGQRDVPAEVVEWNRDGTQIAVGYIDGDIQVWDTNSNLQSTALVQTSDYPITDIAWSPVDSFIAAADGDAVRVWSSVDGSLIGIFNEGSRTVAFNPINGDLAFGIQDSGLAVVPRLTITPTPGLVISHTGPGTIFDDDGAHAAEGAQVGDRYGLRLAVAPIAPVAVTISSSSPADVRLAGGARWQPVLARTITFQTGSNPTDSVINWDDTFTLSLTALADGLAEGAETHQILYTLTSADPAYNGLVVPSTPVTVYDSGVSISPLAMAADEGGSGAYSVVLTAPPGLSLPTPRPEAVTVALNASGAPLSGLPASLTFTRANWNIPQVVAFTAPDDGIANSPPLQAVIAHAVSSDITTLASHYSSANASAPSVTVAVSGG